MKTLFLFIIITISVAFCFSNNYENSTKDSESVEFYTVTGRIIDSESNEKLAGVLVSLDSYKTYTNFDGVFVLNIPTYLTNRTIFVSYISYEDAEIQFSNKSLESIKLKQIK